VIAEGNERRRKREWQKNGWQKNGGRKDRRGAAGALEKRSRRDRARRWVNIGTAKSENRAVTFFRFLFLLSANRKNQQVFFR